MNRSTPMSWLKKTVLYYILIGVKVIKNIIKTSFQLFLLIKNTEKIEIFHMFAPDQKNIPQKKKTAHSKNAFWPSKLDF